jgi:hypothetical protein
VRFLKAPEFWGGVLLGYLLVVAFPSLNLRAGPIRASAGPAR